ncbi:xylulokinase [Veronia pacifica]|uniref:Xylulose kinase n=2 Tax=Veronia pacifica TaxID=1080227 RepID=A0A1C3EKZ8_9GAMM|nr:xylulokinase [Veronia pacifica]
MGIDLGTQSLKIVIYDPCRKMIIASSDAPLPICQDISGKSEQQASWWIDALKSACDQLPFQIKQTVKSIAVSGQQHGFVPLDSDGNVIYPVKLWNDTTTIQECGQIREAYGGDSELLRKVGNTILPGYTIPKVLWLKNNHPDIYRKLACILLPHDYLNYYLTGRQVMECGDASGTGVLNIRTRFWDKELLNCIDPDGGLFDCLPELINADSAVGYVQPVIADTLGLPSGVKVASGGGDNMMAAIGTGNVREGIATVSLGTSSTLFAFSETAVIDHKDGAVAAFCSSTNGWLPLICSLNCANGKKLIETLFGMDGDHLAFEGLLRTSSVGSEGVLTLPFFDGERSPYLPDAQGSVFGLNSHNFTRSNLMRSMIEGATYTLKMGFDRLTDLGMSFDEIRLTGGGSLSQIWVQIVADVFNRPVLLMDSHNGAAFGAAIQALWLLENEHQNIVSLCNEHVEQRLTSRIEPNALSVKKYRLEYQRFVRAVSTVKAFY